MPRVLVARMFFCDSPMCKMYSITIFRFLSNRTEAGAAGNPQEPGVCTPEFLHIDGDTKGRRAGPGRAFRKPYNSHLEEKKKYNFLCIIKYINPPPPHIHTPQK